MITQRQRQILNFIDEYIQAKGYSPTVREIGEGVDLYSSASVHRHLGVLIAKGYIKKIESAPRTIRVLKK